MKAACVARGLYENDDEWQQCLREAAIIQSGVQLRLLFVTILIHGSPNNPRHLWNEFHVHLSDDYNWRLRRSGVEQVTQDQVDSFALNEIAQLLSASDKSLESLDLPQPTIPMNESEDNRFILEQLSGNIDELKEEVAREIVTLNVEQLEIYDKVIRATAEDHSDHIYFVDGPGGTDLSAESTVEIAALAEQNRTSGCILRNSCTIATKRENGSFTIQNTN